MAIGGMIESMMIIAFAVGLILGGAVLYPVMSTALTILHTLPFLSRRVFYAAYSEADDRATYDFLALDGIKSHKAYLGLHEAAQESAYDIFRIFYRNVVVGFMLQRGILVLLPAIIFWGNWYWYMTGVFVIFIFSLTASEKYSKNRAGFYQRAMMRAVFTEYLKR